jgi:hypothetical protein
VHPGEEGTGRRYFPAKGDKPPCVRLINSSYYERRHLGLSWQQWCENKGIPFTANKAGERHEVVKRVPIGKSIDVGRRITNALFEDLKDPARKKQIFAAAAKYIAEHPLDGWDETIAIVKAMQDEVKRAKVEQAKKAAEVADPGGSSTGGFGATVVE